MNNADQPYVNRDAGNDRYQEALNAAIGRYMRDTGSLPENPWDLARFANAMIKDRNFLGTVNRLYARGVNVKIIDNTGASLTFAAKNCRDRPREIRLKKPFDPGDKINVKQYAFLLTLRHDLLSSLWLRQYNRSLKQPAGVSADHGGGRRPPLSSGSFEKEFKELAASGKAGNVLETAKTIMNRMSAKDKADLTVSLKASGVNTVNDLEGLLVRWKTEALNREQAPRMTWSRNQSRAAYSISL
jgi:hypothetical protein